MLAIPDSQVVRHRSAYRVDGEVGRFEFETYDVRDTDGRIAFHGFGALPIRTGKQWYQTAGFKENAILHGVLDRSYRKTAVAFNTQRLDRWLAPTGRDLPPAVLSMHRQRLAAQWNTMLHRQIQTLALTCSSSA